MPDPVHVSGEVQDQYHLLEKCYLEEVKPLLVILERIDVAFPVDEKQASTMPTKMQDSEQPSKKFPQGMCIPRKSKHAQTGSACIKKM